MTRDVLRGIFPGADVVLLPGRRIDRSWAPGGASLLRFDDGLRNEPVYAVSGPPATDNERCASSNVGLEVMTWQREVRIKIYSWPGPAAGASRVLAIVHYAYPDAFPPNACPSIARAIRLDRLGGTWQVVDALDLDPSHLRSLGDVRLADLSGDGIGELLLETNVSGGGGVVTALIVVDLSQGKLERRFHQAVRGQMHLGVDEYSMTLDEPETRRRRARDICFTVTTYSRDDVKFQPPEVTRRCYPARARQ